jgi:hypothetical protein
MRSKMFVPTLCVTLIAGLATGSIQAQGTGPVAFNVTASALTGTVACNGGAATPIAPVDASTSDGNGGLNDVSASSLSANACGFPLYTMQSVEDASFTADTGSSDVGNGGNGITQISLLGGILTYQAKTEYDLCGASASGNTATINCQDTTQIQNLMFAGQSITGTFTQPQTFNAVDVQVQLPGYCTGIALFTGSLTVDSVSQQQSGNSGTIAIAPIALNGTLSCIGLPLGSVTVNLQDEALLEYGLVASFAAIAVETSTIGISSNPTSLFNDAILTNLNQ